MRLSHRPRGLSKRRKSFKAGVSIVGAPLVNINSGGGGSGAQPVAPAAPADPAAPKDFADPLAS
ncbi:hypothetical protein [Aquabacterium sp.]|uniref:hypothetical protein n=1 Tax=Aquabacterium sp. TaxID=1872578 RepID=UPI0019BC99A9|nr:hypothetical protein [Aquabacterium sp.]MBC7699611.1 hypothetical protein [Aquabacterium sp.]